MPAGGLYAAHFVHLLATRRPPSTKRNWTLRRLRHQGSNVRSWPLADIFSKRWDVRSRQQTGHDVGRPSSRLVTLSGRQLVTNECPLRTQEQSSCHATRRGQRSHLPGHPALLTSILLGRGM